ncbi:uncharacterized protein PITG_03983 [Phytophthora infestans T30-4]|uniref:Uncharacterized protein n=1 Tax=Phytophthora infestans (strain T30-4) TaxID=403677 RepID=D0MZ13_PHYIT|nr:uncharacterized protein PITG_03983 [Phytophthora infestans T30-4]EEY66411.1 conserved hypothetical protein [Phytophthora infestans T30-4]|eukprot:XP_002907010.1 conserved hypothetical protein [Phytophthora infestans T30-4]
MASRLFNYLKDATYLRYEPSRRRDVAKQVRHPSAPVDMKSDGFSVSGRDLRDAKRALRSRLWERISVYTTKTHAGCASVMPRDQTVSFKQTLTAMGHDSTSWYKQRKTASKTGQTDAENIFLESNASSELQTLQNVEEAHRPALPSRLHIQRVQPHVRDSKWKAKTASTKAHRATRVAARPTPTSASTPPVQPNKNMASRLFNYLKDATYLRYEPSQRRDVAKQVRHSSAPVDMKSDGFSVSGRGLRDAKRALRSRLWERISVYTTKMHAGCASVMPRDQTVSFKQTPTAMGHDSTSWYKQRKTASKTGQTDAENIFLESNASSEVRCDTVKNLNIQKVPLPFDFSSKLYKMSRKPIALHFLVDSTSNVCSHTSSHANFCFNTPVQPNKNMASRLFNYLKDATYLRYEPSRRRDVVKQVRHPSALVDMKSDGFSVSGRGLRDAKRALRSRLWECISVYTTKTHTGCAHHTSSFKQTPTAMGHDSTCAMTYSWEGRLAPVHFNKVTRMFRYRLLLAPNSTNVEEAHRLALPSRLHIQRVQPHVSDSQWKAKTANTKAHRATRVAARPTPISASTHPVQPNKNMASRLFNYLKDATYLRYAPSRRRDVAKQMRHPSAPVDMKSDGFSVSGRGLRDAKRALRSRLWECISVYTTKTHTICAVSVMPRDQTVSFKQTPTAMGHDSTSWYKQRKTASKTGQTDAENIFLESNASSELQTLQNVEKAHRPALPSRLHIQRVQPRVSDSKWKAKTANTKAHRATRVAARPTPTSASTPPVQPNKNMASRLFNYLKDATYLRYEPSQRRDVAKQVRHSSAPVDMKSDGFSVSGRGLRDAKRALRSRLWECISVYTTKTHTICAVSVMPRDQTDIRKKDFIGHVIGNLQTLQNVEKAHRPALPSRLHIQRVQPHVSDSKWKAKTANTKARRATRVAARPTPTSASTHPVQPNKNMASRLFNYLKDATYLRYEPSRRRDVAKQVRHPSAPVDMKSDGFSVSGRGLRDAKLYEADFGNASRITPVSFKQTPTAMGHDSTSWYKQRKTASKTGQTDAENIFLESNASSELQTLQNVEKAHRPALPSRLHIQRVQPHVSDSKWKAKTANTKARRATRVAARPTPTSASTHPVQPNKNMASRLFNYLKDATYLRYEPSRRRDVAKQVRHPSAPVDMKSDGFSVSGRGLRDAKRALRSRLWECISVYTTKTHAGCATPTAMGHDSTSWYKQRKTASKTGQTDAENIFLESNASSELQTLQNVEKAHRPALPSRLHIQRVQPHVSDSKWKAKTANTKARRATRVAARPTPTSASTHPVQPNKNMASRLFNYLKDATYLRYEPSRRRDVAKQVRHPSAPVDMKSDGFSVSGRGLRDAKGALRSRLWECISVYTTKTHTICAVSVMPRDQTVSFKQTPTAMGHDSTSWYKQRKTASKTGQTDAENIFLESNASSELQTLQNVEEAHRPALPSRLHIQRVQPRVSDSKWKAKTANTKAHRATRVAARPTPTSASTLPSSPTRTWRPGLFNYSQRRHVSQIRAESRRDVAKQVRHSSAPVDMKSDGFSVSGRGLRDAKRALRSRLWERISVYTTKTHAGCAWSVMPRDPTVNFIDYMRRQANGIKAAMMPGVIDVLTVVPIEDIRKKDFIGHVIDNLQTLQNVEEAHRPALPSRLHIQRVQPRVSDSKWKAKTANTKAHRATRVAARPTPTSASTHPVQPNKNMASRLFNYLKDATYLRYEPSQRRDVAKQVRHSSAPVDMKSDGFSVSGRGLRDAKRALRSRLWECISVYTTKMHAGCASVMPRDQTDIRKKDFIGHVIGNLQTLQNVEEAHRPALPSRLHIQRVQPHVSDSKWKAKTFNTKAHRATRVAARPTPTSASTHPVQPNKNMASRLFSYLKDATYLRYEPSQRRDVAKQVRHSSAPVDMKSDGFSVSGRGLRDAKRALRSRLWECISVYTTKMHAGCASVMPRDQTGNFIDFMRRQANGVTCSVKSKDHLT